MSNFDIKPAINYISIRNDGIDYEKADIDLYKTKDNKILFSFGISGLNKLEYPITGHNVPFYLFIAITYQNGGKDFEIISLSDVFVTGEMLELDNLKMHGSLEIPASKVYDNDFVHTVYYFSISHTHKEITDEKEMNSLLYPSDSSLFYSKLNVVIKE